NAHASFNRVAALNEAAKELLARSRHVNLLALDAMVQSKRGGSSLRGFDEVSSQMRRWSRDLHVELQGLAALSCQVVTEVSRACKEAHLLRLLQRAAEATSSPAASRTFLQRSAMQENRELTLIRLWRKVVDALGDLDQLGMMAVVLSRSAMIEASSGADEQRAQLAQVSQEFYGSSESVMNVLKLTLKEMRR
ncbi:MAG: hypothetical protein K0R38_7351, partial [Polyangiaceae bacterium]|nr:hypothetical protein [Polyangiaceae bacterium]